MGIFEPTNKRLQKIKARIPEFPVEMMLLVRMTYHIQKNMRDITNAVLKEHDLTDVGYTVLGVLYGSEDECATASVLGQACNEKPANLTRVCNELEERELIARVTRQGDRRSVIISLTDKGRKLIESALPIVCGSLTHAYDGFTSEELKLLQDMYIRQLRNL